MLSPNLLARLIAIVPSTGRLTAGRYSTSRRFLCLLGCGLVYVVTGAVAELPYRDSPVIREVIVEGRPLFEELGGESASGSGLWLRNDTLFSAKFSGVSRYIAFKRLADDTWMPYSMARVTTNITSSAVSRDGRFIALGYEGGGIELSTDGGQSFAAVNSPTTFNVNRIAVRSDGRIVLGRVPEGDMFVSDDYGNSWFLEDLPPVPEGSSYGQLDDLKFNDHDILTFVTSVVSGNGDFVRRVFVRSTASSWQSFDVRGASKVFTVDGELLRVSTSRPIPGRIDDTGITELLEVDTRTGQIDTAFSFVAETDKSSINHVWVSGHHKLVLAVTFGSFISNTDSLWYRERVTTPSFIAAYKLFVEASATDVYAVASPRVIRLRLSPVSSLPRYLDASTDVGVVLKDGRLAPGSVVYDILGRVVHTNYAHEPAFWQPATSGMYFVTDSKTGRVQSRAY